MRSSITSVVQRFARSLATGLGTITLLGMVSWAQAQLTITTTSPLPNGQVAGPYSETLAATEGTGDYTWSITAGSLPAGLSLNAETGEISGTPTTVGTSSFTVFVFDDTSSGAKAFQLTIDPEVLSIDTATAPPGVEDAAYEYDVPASGGYPPYVWALLSDPNDIFNDDELEFTSGGKILGTVTNAGSYTFIVGVTDSQLGSDTATLTLNIAETALTVTTASLPGSFIDVSYSTELEADGGVDSYAWAFVTWNEETGSWDELEGEDLDDVLPEGLTLNGETGVISGTPAAGSAGTYEFTVQVTDSIELTAVRALSITAAVPSDLTALTTSLPGGQSGVNYSATVMVSGGVPPYVFEVVAGDLPEGLMLNGEGEDAGKISGFPTSETGENPSFTIRATDTRATDPASIDIPLSINIAAPGTVVVTTTELPSGPLGSSYEATIAVSGGVAPYTFEAFEWDGDSWEKVPDEDIDDVLPPGLTFDDGQITGVPVELGTFTFQLRALDRYDVASANQQLSIEITEVQPLVITTTQLPPGAEGTPYLVSTDPDDVPVVLEATGGVLYNDENGEHYQWMIVEGMLPPGLQLDPISGTIGGEPNEGSSGTYDFRVRVEDSVFSATAKLLSMIVIEGAVTVVTTDLPDGQAGVAYLDAGDPVALEADAGLEPYTWSIAEGALPAGLTLAADTGVISGAPQQAGNYTIKVRVVDDLGGQDTSDNLEFTIGAAEELDVTTDALKDGPVGVSYNQTLAASGGVKPYTWAVASGSLPGGLTLTESGDDAGKISGVPTEEGGFTFTVEVTDVLATNATQELSIMVLPPVALEILTESLQGGTVREVYEVDEDTPVALAANGGVPPYTWSIVQGGLPPGLTLSSNGEITGAPTDDGNYDFTARVTDTLFNAVAKALSIKTELIKLELDTTSLPDGKVAVAYTATLEASDGYEPYTWGTYKWVDVNSGDDEDWQAQPISPEDALPAGLVLDTANGTISGVPGEEGIFTVFVGVTDDEGQLVVTPRGSGIEFEIVGPDPLAFVTDSLPDGQVGLPYGATLQASGGYTPYIWNLVAGALPQGLSLDPATGVISGMPTMAGLYGFTIQLNDAQFTAISGTLSINVAIASSPEIITTELPSGVVDTAYTAAIQAVGGIEPYAWAITEGALPEGLTLDPETGAISGTPTAQGTTEFTVAVTDAQMLSASAPLSISIELPELVIVTEALPDAERDVAYEATLEAAGGAAPYTWAVTVGTLPEGLTLDPATGVISGTPTAGGTSEITVEVTDGQPVSASTTLTITVITPPLVIVTEDLPVAEVGKAYAATLEASGGTAPFTWAVTAGTLPDGLTLDPATGAISGEPTTEGDVEITVEVADAAEGTASKALTISVITPSPLTIVTEALPAGEVSAVYEAMLEAAGGTEPYTWAITAGTLPGGLTLDPATGAISGTPTASGSSEITVEVTDAETTTASATLTISVAPAPLVIETTELPAGDEGLAYEATLEAAGGTEPYTWAITAGTLPGGLTLDPATGAISGTPTASGSSEITVEVTDADTTTAMQTLTLTINPSEPPESYSIAWVSFHPADDSPSQAAADAGFTEAPDVGYTQMLSAAGHTVTRILTTGTPDTSLLSKFDLVIISRSNPSSNFQGANGTRWNSIEEPIIVVNGYVMRDSRMGYTTGGTMVDTTSTISLTVNDAAHPVFAGIALDDANTMVNPYADIVTVDLAGTPTLQRGISVNTDPVAGGGTVLAVVATADDPTLGGLVVGEWQAGATMGNGTADTLAGHRLVILTGSREQDITSEAAGIYDLEPDGAQMLLNAVSYMAEPKVVINPPTIVGGNIEFTWRGGGEVLTAPSVNGPWTGTGETSGTYSAPVGTGEMYFQIAD